MSLRAPLIAGTALSLAAVAAWSFTATLTIGPAAPVRLDRNPAADYARLAGTPTGNGIALFTVTAAIYAACLLASGLRQRKRMRNGG